MKTFVKTFKAWEYPEDLEDEINAYVKEHKVEIMQITNICERNDTYFVLVTFKKK